MEPVHCLNCGHELPDGARFCPSCGTPRARPQAETVVDVPAPAEPSPPTERIRPAADTSSATERIEPVAATPPPTERSGPAAETPPPAGGSEPVAETPPPAERIEPATPPPPPPPPPRDPPAADPAELARRLGAQLRRPLVAASLAGGALAAVACVLFGLLVGVIFPARDSLIGTLGNGAGFFREGLRHAVGFLQVPFDNFPLPTARGTVSVTRRVAPLVWLLVPVGAVAAVVTVVFARLRGVSVRGRLIAAAGIVVTFAMLMLLCALSAGDTDPDAGLTVLAALGWGALGAAIAARRTGMTPGRRPSPALRPVLAAARAALRPLGLLLLVCGVLGTGAWIVKVLTDQDAKATGRDVAEVSLFAVDHSVHFAELGALVPFAANPRAAQVIGLPAPARGAGEVSPGKPFRIFAYDDGLPSAVFIAGVIVLLALPLLFALYAGFAAAGAAAAAAGAGAPGPRWLPVAWGAVVGPVWGLVMAVLDGLASNSLSISGGDGTTAVLHIFGTAQGAGALALFLLVGTVLGALGGLLAGGASAPARA